MTCHIYHLLCGFHGNAQSLLNCILTVSVPLIYERGKKKQTDDTAFPCLPPLSTVDQHTPPPAKSSFPPTLCTTHQSYLNTLYLAWNILPIIPTHGLMRRGCSCPCMRKEFLHKLLWRSAFPTRRSEIAL